MKLFYLFVNSETEMNKYTSMNTHSPSQEILVYGIGNTCMFQKLKKNHYFICYFMKKLTLGFIESKLF